MLDAALMRIMARLDALERQAERRAAVDTSGLTIARLATAAPVSVGSVDLQNISQGYTTLIVAVSTRNTAGNASVIAQLSTDGTTMDASASYDYQYHFGNGASVGAAEAFAQTSLFTGSHATAANGMASALLVFEDYVNTTHHKSMLSAYGYKFGTTTGSMVDALVWGTWRNVSPIRGIRFATSAGLFDAGSTIRLYGLP